MATKKTTGRKTARTVRRTGRKTVRVASNEILVKRFRELSQARFKEFEAGLLRQKALADRAAKYEKRREDGRREFLQSLGINLEALDRGRDKRRVSQMKELKEFLDEFKPAAVSRSGRGAANAKDAAVRSATLAEAGYVILNPFAASIFVDDVSLIATDPGESGTGAINSGWVLPEDPTRIRLMLAHEGSYWCYQAVAGLNPEFAVHFAFVPASTATYEMTAILAFHGFYVLRSDDGYFSCCSAAVRLSVQMNVNQYVDIGWKSFPALIDREESNAEEVTTYDHTHFFDYTPTVLKAGDPVVVTVKGELYALGDDAYAEINFQSGSANFIQPLFLSVRQT